MTAIQAAVAATEREGIIMETIKVAKMMRPTLLRRSDRRNNPSGIIINRSDIPLSPHDVCWALLDLYADKKINGYEVSRRRVRVYP